MRGRARRGTPIIRARSCYANKFTLHVYAKRSCVLHWGLSDKNEDTREIERVAVAAAHKIQHGDVLVWDRLGQHDIRPNFPTNGQPLSKSKVASLVRGYVDER